MKKLLPDITCPHCWAHFPPHDLLWLAEHPDLQGDLRLSGPISTKGDRTFQHCFRPIRFDLNNRPLDLEGIPCTKRACPNCHLFIPERLLDTPPLFLSIAGAPQAGKSYYLGNMVYHVQKAAARFGLNFNDEATELNGLINRYKNTFYGQNDQELYVDIEKTEEVGELWYSTIYDGIHKYAYPRPFVFGVRLKEDKHPHAKQKENRERILCLYDNAGESFLPGMEKRLHPVTRHLAESSAVLFLFDPTQDPNLRSVLRKTSEDPQLESVQDKGPRVESGTQDPDQQQILNVVAERIKAERQSGGTMIDAPLIVLVAKADVLPPIEGVPCFQDVTNATYKAVNTTCYDKSESLWKLNLSTIRDISNSLRAFMEQHVPQFVSAAEANWSPDQIYYVPVSALGRSPHRVQREDGQGSYLAIRPDNLRPLFVELPMLLAFHLANNKLVLSAD